MDITLQLYTVPGQVHYNSTRQLVLRGADGVVFVADSQRAMQNSNTDSFKNLQENLLLQGISLDGFPHVLQFNKRDLRDVVPVEELNDEINRYSVPIFEATATDGVGVQETLEGIVKLVMRNLRQRYEGAITGARTPGVEDSQVGRAQESIPDAPPTPPPGPTEVVPPEAPPEPISVAESPPVEPIVPPEPPPPVEPVVPPEPSPPVDEPAPAEAPPASSIVEPMTPVDPAKTIDFSQAGGSDPFGGLGGGFEDEVSTAVYDADDDSAIDFEELKKLDAQQRAPLPPRTPEPPPAYEPPPAEYSEFDGVDPVAEVAPPQVTEQPPPAFDLDSTDAGLKTQDASQVRAEDAMADFDFQATPPDMDSNPDFELDLPEPEPEPEPPEIQVEVIPPTVDFEVPTELEPPAVEGFPPAETAPPPPVEVEGMYVDRIEAPSPFAPNPEAPGGSAEVRQALGSLEDREAVAVPEDIEAPPAVVVPEGFDAPPAAVVPEEIESLPAAVVPEEFEAPPAASVDEDIEAPPIVDADELFEVPPVAAVDEEIEVLPVGVDDELFEATPHEPVMVGSEDPWTEEELSGVYDLAEVEKAERAAAIEAAEPRPVEVRAEDNQLHLRLQGTGAIIESGQVRALDIEVPVPGSWVGHRRVTLQLRLTLTPDTEDEDDGPVSPS